MQPESEQESDSQIWKISGTGFKNFETGAESESEKVTPATSGVCAVISQVKTWENYSWIGDCSWSLNGSRILKLEKLPDRIRTRIQKFWNMSGVGVWKSDSVHLWYSYTE